MNVNHTHRSVDLIRSIGFATIYVFFFLYSVGPALGLGEKYVIALWCMMAEALLIMVFEIRKNKLIYKSYALWMSCFIAYSLMSCLYAVNAESAFGNTAAMLKILLKVFSVFIICKDFNGIRKLIRYFALLGGLVFLTLYLTGNLYETWRLGTDLLGNANSFALIVMITLMCDLFNLVYEKKISFKILWGIIAIGDIYLMLLSGGRKFIIFLVVFSFILLILNKTKERRSSFVKATVIIVLALVGMYYAIMNVEVLYNSIGIRIIGLDSNSQTMMGSDAQKYLMTEGIKFFFQRPVFGWGANGYANLFLKYHGTYIYSHCNYVELLTNYGILGFVLYYSMYLYLILNLVKIKNDDNNMRNFFIAFLIGLLPFELFSITYNQTAFIPMFIFFANMYVEKTKHMQSI